MAWWQYVLARHTTDPNVNPLRDPTGAICANGQSGPVFFLVGTEGGQATRSQCTVPAGKALFFPLVNAFDVHVPGDGLDTPPLVWADLQNNQFSARTDTASLYATVDGVQVGNLTPTTTPYRACVGPVAGCMPPSYFDITLPDNNEFQIAGGTYSPAVADGFYLLLAPLPPGSHTITFGAAYTYAGAANSQDITYHLKVSAP